MKAYLTVDEAKSIIKLIKSEDEENVILGLYFLTGKTFKTTRHLRTCIDNAERLLIIMSKEYKFYDDIYNCKVRISNSLAAYIHLHSKYLQKGHTGN